MNALSAQIPADLRNRSGKLASLLGVIPADLSAAIAHIGDNRSSKLGSSSCKLHESLLVEFLGNGFDLRRIRFGEFLTISKVAMMTSLSETTLLSCTTCFTY